MSDLETTEEKCSALDDTISEMNSVKAKVGVDLSEVDQANTIIQYCVAQKQQLEAPAVMNVDVSQVSGKIGEAVGLLQEFQTAQNTLQMQETLGMDTSEAQANVEAVADKIKGLDTNVKATLSIDDSSIDTIQDSISNKLTNEVMVKAGIDDSAIIGFQETKHVAMATKVSLPYHADGSQCKVYTYQDIIKIYCEIQKLILAETSYCNALNTYVRGLNTKEQIAAVKYGQEITEQAIKTNMDTVIAQGNAVMEGIVKQYLETAVPETKTDVKDTENTTDGTDNIEDAATEKSSKKA